MRLVIVTSYIFPCEASDFGIPVRPTTAKKTAIDVKAKILTVFDFIEK